MYPIFVVSIRKPFSKLISKISPVTVADEKVSPLLNDVSFLFKPPIVHSFDTGL
ncbi:hypothetical protein D3C77_789100 [compost metagenome]